MCCVKLPAVPICWKGKDPIGSLTTEGTGPPGEVWGGCALNCVANKSKLAFIDVSLLLTHAQKLIS